MKTVKWQHIAASIACLVAGDCLGYELATHANITANFPVGLTTVRITIKARDVNMNLVTVYTTEKRIYGVDPVVRYNLVKGVYRDMLARLTSGNLESGNVSPDYANLLITRDEAGDKFGYYVYLVRAADGIWRIDGM